jgi:hypothetical protein
MNKVSSRVTLWIDVVNSPSLSQEQKDSIVNRLGNRIGKASRWKPEAVGLPRSAE